MEMEMQMEKEKARGKRNRKLKLKLKSLLSSYLLFNAFTSAVVFVLVLVFFSSFVLMSVRFCLASRKLFTCFAALAIIVIGLLFLPLNNKSRNEKYLHHLPTLLLLPTKDKQISHNWLPV